MFATYTFFTTKILVFKANGIAQQSGGLQTVLLQLCILYTCMHKKNT